MTTNAQMHTCDGCGRTEPWGPGWSWFGRWLDIDSRAGRPIVKACSTECRDRLGHPPDPRRGDRGLHWRRQAQARKEGQPCS